MAVRLGNMGPGSSRGDKPDGLVRNAEFLGHCSTLLAVGIVLAYFASGALGELGQSVSLSLRASPFINHVLRVVGTGAEEQVLWVTAQSHIALVANDQTRRDRAVSQDVREAMGGNASIPLSPKTDHAATVSRNRSSPKDAPAFVGRGQMGAEAIPNRNDTPLVVAGARAVVPALSLGVPSRLGKGLSAAFTGEVLPLQGVFDVRHVADHTTYFKDINNKVGELTDAELITRGQNG